MQEWHHLSHLLPRASPPESRQTLAILLTRKERINTWASWKRLIPKCAIMATATSRLRKGLQLTDPSILTSYKQKKLPFYVRMAVQKGRVSFTCQGSSWSPVMEENWTCPPVTVIWTRWAIHRTALGRELFHQCCKKQNHHQHYQP